MSASTLIVPRTVTHPLLADAVFVVAVMVILASRSEDGIGLAEAKLVTCWGRQFPDCDPAGVTMRGAGPLVTLNTISSAAWLAFMIPPMGCAAAAATAAGVRLAASPSRGSITPCMVRTAVPGAEAGCAFVINENTDAGITVVLCRMQGSRADEICNRAMEETTSSSPVRAPPAADPVGGDDNPDIDDRLRKIGLSSPKEAVNESIDNVPRVPKDHVTEDIRKPIGVFLLTSPTRKLRPLPPITIILIDISQAVRSAPVATARRFQTWQPPPCGRLARVV